MTCTATVTYTPTANVSGADSFKFKVSASGLDSDPADVNVAVSSVNDPPTFGITGNHTINEDAGPQVVPNFAFNISPGPANESSQTVQFMVTGDTVNTASRLESNAKAGEILVSEATAQAARSRYQLAPRDPISVKNREQPVPLFEIEWQHAISSA